MASIKDVAKAAGVSTATVSRVLTNKHVIRPETRERVLRAVRELNYRPNLVARSLRAQRTARLGLVFSDIRNPFFASLSRVVEDAAYERGYSVLICNTDEDPDKETLYLNLLHDENVAGIIFSPTQQFSTQDTPFQFDIPVVVIDRQVKWQALDTVRLDNLSAARELTEHLLARGYRRLGGIFGEASTTGQERFQGFTEALSARGLQPQGVKLVPPRMAAGRSAAAHLLDQFDPPDGLVTSNSLLTAGAFQAIRERGLRIPADLALVGFDVTEWAEFVEPPITVIAQPTEQIGRAAVELLFKRISEPDAPVREITLRGNLLVRGSSAAKR